MSKVIQVNLNNNDDLNKLKDINDQVLLTNIKNSSHESENDISYWIIIVAEDKAVCYAHISGQKDIKQARVTISHTNVDKRQKRKVIEESQKVAFSTLEMETIFYIINPEDKDSISILTELGLTNLGGLDNDVVFLADNKVSKDNKKGFMQ